MLLPSSIIGSWRQVNFVLHQPRLPPPIKPVHLIINQPPQFVSQLLRPVVRLQPAFPIEKLRHCLIHNAFRVMTLRQHALRVAPPPPISHQPSRVPINPSGQLVPIFPLKRPLQLRAHTPFLQPLLCQPLPPAPIQVSEKSQEIFPPGGKFRPLTAISIWARNGPSRITKKMPQTKRIPMKTPLCSYTCLALLVNRVIEAAPPAPPRITSFCARGLHYFAPLCTTLHYS